MFEQPESESIRRLQARRIDPETGNLFNLEIAPPSNDKVTSRLSAMAEDKEDVIRARMNHWTAQQHHVEDAYKDMLFTVQADQPIDQVTEVISDVILNPIF